jgi:hypothetical protein
MASNLEGAGGRPDPGKTGTTFNDATDFRPR